ncbi:dynamin family protein [Cellulomonas sp. C5510]|uniref:dynamin family protein n=1 Tax=Cellulomonas sp. C5510 TaxID=2871170 RepID=UPI0021063B26|nr:dynamin family protein [Cellulomonas sp. C5510]
MHAEAGSSAAGDVLDRPLAATSLLDAVTDLLRDTRATDFPLDVPGAEQARASCTRLVDQLADHLVPRLRQLSAPAVVVVAGSTGAGKSTLVNSLVGAEVSAAGVLRPTTRRPVLVHHPDDAELVREHPVTDAVDVVASEQVPRGIALMDAPDLDSVLESNRRSAQRLLEAADLWLFVTTAARYGDALPWRVLGEATARGASVAMVLNRVDPASLPTVRGDLLERLRAHGMQGSPLFVVPDLGPHEGLLEPARVAPVKRWLTMLAGPDRARTVVARTLRGSLAALRPWVDELADAVERQAEAATAIRAALDDAVRGPAEEARRTVASGAVSQGSAQARWVELTAPGAPLAGAVRPSGRVDRSRRAGKDRATAVLPLVQDLVSSASATLAAVGAATERTLRDALATGPDGARSAAREWSASDRAADRPREVERAAREWVASAVEVLEDELGRARPAPVDRSGRRAAVRADRRVAAGRRALGDEGLAALALAAAAGLDAADRMLRGLLGDRGDAAVRVLRDRLADQAAAQAHRERDAAAAVLDRPELRPDAASLLRLRLAVVKGLT